MVDRRGFSTALAVLALVHGRVVVQVAPEVVEVATVMAPDAQGWCTDLEEDPEEPHLSRKTMEP